MYLYILYFGVQYITQLIRRPWVTYHYLKVFGGPDEAFIRVQSKKENKEMGGGGLRPTSYPKMWN